MEIDKYVIRRMDNSNVVLHRNLGKHKDGSYRTQDPVYYLGTVEEAILRLRREVKNRHLAGKAQFNDIAKTFSKLDRELIETLLKKGQDELALLIQESLNDRHYRKKLNIEEQKIAKEKAKDGKKRVYLAGGWFNPTQIKVLTEVEQLLIKQSKYDVFMPRVHNEGTANSDWDLVYKRNIDELEDCSFMIACTEGKDMGTLLEVGRFMEKGKPVIFYTPGLTGPFNLMLAKEAQRVCTTKDELRDALKNLNKKVEYNAEYE